MRETSFRAMKFFPYILAVACLYTTALQVCVADPYSDYGERWEKILNSMTNAQDINTTTQMLSGGGWAAVWTNTPGTNQSWHLMPKRTKQIQITSSNRQQMLKRCAEILRSTIDTNQVNLLCSNLMNMPAIIRLGNQAYRDAPMEITLVTNQEVQFQIKSFASLAVSQLEAVARLLEDTQFKISQFNGMGSVTIESPEGSKQLFYVFVPGLQSVQQIEKRTGDGSHVLQRMIFYEDGQIKFFDTISPGREGLSFKPDRTIDSYSRPLPNGNELSIRVDETGKLKIRCFLHR